MVEKIKALCKQKGIGINELEDILEFGNGAIYKWKKSSPRLDSVKRVADYFGVTVNDLLDYPQTDLNIAEKKVIEQFRNLNKEGQEEVFRHLNYLLHTPEYIKNNPNKAVEGIA